MSTEEIKNYPFAQIDKSNDEKNLNEKVAKLKRKINYAQVLAELQTNYPIAFPIDENERVPLKLGIHRDILANTELIKKLNLDNNSLYKFMFCYTTSQSYLIKQIENTFRYDLSGTQAGKVSKDQEILAKSKMQKLKADLV